MAHLEFLSQQLPANGPQSEEDIFIRRQLAISYARCGRIDDANAVWESLLAGNNNSLAVRIEAIRFLRNADRFERAHEVCTAALAETSSDTLHSDEGNELLTEHGLVFYQYQGLQKPSTSSYL